MRAYKEPGPKWLRVVRLSICVFRFFGLCFHRDGVPGMRLRRSHHPAWITLKPRRREFSSIWSLRASRIGLHHAL
ncbi:hypothetical protein BDR07DRAFT_1399047 [Suillus spraguei]|nr:hypothetical protein BDR07DRAFT_1399047 [Suillus spraguei]